MGGNIEGGKCWRREMLMAGNIYFADVADEHCSIFFFLLHKLFGAFNIASINIPPEPPQSFANWTNHSRCVLIFVCVQIGKGSMYVHKRMKRFSNNVTRNVKIIPVFNIFCYLPFSAPITVTIYPTSLRRKVK